MCPNAAVPQQEQDMRNEDAHMVTIYGRKGSELAENDKTDMTSLKEASDAFKNATADEATDAEPIVEHAKAGEDESTPEPEALHRSEDEIVMEGFVGAATSKLTGLGLGNFIRKTHPLMTALLGQHQVAVPEVECVDEANKPVVPVLRVRHDGDVGVLCLEAPSAGGMAREDLAELDDEEKRACIRRFTKFLTRED